jgi:hypothetical protein
MYIRVEFSVHSQLIPVFLFTDLTRDPAAHAAFRGIP